MTRLGRVVNGLALAVVLVSPAARVHADDQDVVDYRQHIMKTLGEQVASIDMILHQTAPADNFATHTKILAVTAATARKAFEPKVPGGDSKPEVWSNWADFAKQMDTLAAAAEELAKTAVSGGLSAAQPKVQAALACKGCHDTYRVSRK